MCWRESRPVVQAIFQFRFLTGFLLARHVWALRLAASYLPAAAIWLAATTAIYLVNGLADVTEDHVNGSSRPIALGLLPPSSALRAVGVLSALALGGSGLVVRRLTGLVALLLVLGGLYSLSPLAAKRWSVPAAVITGSGGLVTYLAGAVTVGRLNSNLWAFALLMSAWMGWVGTMTKDLSDVEGDVAAGRRTFVCTRGEAYARRVAGAVAVTIGASGLAIAHRQPLLAGPGVVCALGSVALALCLSPRLSGGSRGRRRLPYRTFMVVQYTAHLVLVLTLLVDAG
ncbi:MAG: UbiA family prenyltransferase [Frankiaceae bacterium]